MKRRLLVAIFLSYILLLCGHAEEAIWTDNKLTPEQPFPAAVRAILQSWVGYDLLLEEIGGEGRLCVVRVWAAAPIKYVIIEDRAKEVAAESERKKAHWNYLSPAIELNRFSWSIGPCKIGRIFGEDDILRFITKPRPTLTQ